MTQAATSVPVKTEEKKAGTARSPALQAWTPFGNLRQEIDRLFDDFGRGLFASPSRRSFAEFEPFWSRATTLSATPAVDIVETDKAYEISAELPGMDEKNIEVKVANGGLTIRGEKKEEKEQKEKDCYVSERSYGSFERYFRVPEGVDVDKIDANLKNGVLKVTLPKKAEAQKPAKKVEIKAAA
jgi:HSP20 family protein